MTITAFVKLLDEAASSAEALSYALEDASSTIRKIPHAYTGDMIAAFEDASEIITGNDCVSAAEAIVGAVTNMLGANPSGEIEDTLKLALPLAETLHESLLNIQATINSAYDTTYWTQQEDLLDGFYGLDELFGGNLVNSGIELDGILQDVRDLLVVAVPR